MRGLLTLQTLSIEKITEIIKTALFYKQGHYPLFRNKTMASMFFENSTRTQYSFQLAMIKLGITPITFDAQYSSVSKGESLYDTVKTFESLGVDGVVIRHSKDEYYKELSNINIPIFNGGDGKSNHPTQTLLDLMTIYEEFGSFEGLRIALVGDIEHSRVAHGDAEVMKRLGMNVFISGPKEYCDDTAPFIPLDKAVLECDIIYLLRIQFERHAEKMQMTQQEYHEKYGLTKSRMKAMKSNAIIMHPAPINRDVEIADEVAECEKSRIYKQMTNGVYVRMAVISMVLEGRL